MDRQGRDLAIIVDFPEKPIVIPHYRSFWNFWAMFLILTRMDLGR
jgi:hypothetical protein